MRSIWKVTLAITDTQIVEMPRDAVPLAVQFQRGVLCLWVHVVTTEPLQCYRVAVVGTGNPADHVRTWVYLGTAQEPVRPLVWHVFMEPVAVARSSAPTPQEGTP